ncbi:MAG TPA: M48 family metallopeptidase [Burkholderiales bacterium]|nr:M48 family metallopeptidase [Burkholderiales bacterium]
MTFTTIKLIAFTIALSFSLNAQAFKLNLDFDKLKGVTEKVKQLKEPDENDEIELGKGISSNLLGAAPLVNDPELQAYVNQVGKWLALHTDRPKLPWRFGVMDDDDVNAFATPGGNIFITRGLLLRMRDEAELAGVLAHEISHVLEKHALNTMKKGAAIGLAGDVLNHYVERKDKGDYTKLVNASTELYTRGLDKEDEFAADRAGVVIAARAGYDPYGLPSVLQTLSSINPKDGAVALMFKTHPDSSERLEKVTGQMDGRLDNLAEQPRVADRFARIMRAHVGRYQPAKR